MVFLRQLSGDIGEIRRRQEHIAHLLLNKDVFGALSAALSHLPDVGRSITRLISGRGTPRDLRATADFMGLLPELKAIGTKIGSAFGIAIYKSEKHLIRLL